MPQLSDSASSAGDGKVLLTLCNVDPHREAEVHCELRGAQVSEATGTILTAQEMGAHNTFQNPERVKPTAFTEIQFNREKVTTVLPPMSVCTLTVQMRS
jgi:alpha-N-arabinofuranosidase